MRVRSELKFDSCLDSYCLSISLSAELSVSFTNKKKENGAYVKKLSLNIQIKSPKDLDNHIWMPNPTYCIEINGSCCMRTSYISQCDPHMTTTCIPVVYYLLGYRSALKVSWHVIQGHIIGREGLELFYNLPVHGYIQKYLKAVVYHTVWFLPTGKSIPVGKMNVS